MYYLVLGLVIYLEEVFFAGFSTREGFPGYIVVVSVIVSLSVILVLIVFGNFARIYLI